MTSPGIELAVEWVTILPETATLVKELKKFQPPPIHVKLVIDKDGNAKSVIDQKAVVKEAEKTGEQAGKAITTGVKSETKDLPKVVGDSARKAGETMKREIVKPIQKVDEDIAKAVDPSRQQGRIRGAAQRVGQAIRDAISNEAGKAGDDTGKKLAASIERAKGAVTKAERSLADARIAAGNIDSRIRQQEQRVQQLREASAAGLKRVAAEEKIYQDMRANSSQHTADQITAQERRLETMQAAQQSRVVRLNAAEESQSRLANSRETSTNRTANAVDNLGAKEAALATAMSLQNDPLEENNRKMKTGGLMAGGMMASLLPLGRQLLVTTGLFTGAAGLAGGISYTLKTGNTFTDTINKMQGVLGRTSGDMGDITSKARELGRDFTLPATSANDAATSMFELTKAGFSAQQAMDAARGSLQLSAAAGISAADASYITGTALNAFGLQATDAAKVTDVLANAANLFPGDMQDFGYSLSQGGAVAKSFGINIEDTTTALGFLAKAGIKSSDAGTLIKTMLLSLTDQGKPAQAAIKDLGLELYDQNHQFKGIEYVYKRLNQASKEMTQEQYQAAAATLFGTDAARFAGLAAGDAAPNWDEFRQKIDKTGTAADVAAARMQGLPGALERMKNAGQELALTIYDMVKGPLEAVVNAVAKVVIAFAGWLAGPFMGFLKNYKEEIIGFAAVLGTYITVLAAIKIATAAWTAVQWLLNAALDANPIGVVVLAIAALVAGAIYAYKHFDWFHKAVDAAWQGIQTAFKAALPVIKAVWDAISTGATWLWNNALKPAFDWIVNTGWPALKTAFQVGWAAIKSVFDVWKAAALFLWNNVLMPVFNWIKGGWTLLWQAMEVGWRAGQVVWEVVKVAALALWHEVFEPVFQGIMDVVRPVWGFLKQAFEGWKIAFGVVGDAAMWLWHTIFEPVWEGIKAGWQALKDFLAPVWDWFKSGIEGIGNIASKIADGIKSAWNGIESVFKVPLHALGSFLAGIPSEILGVHIDAIESVNNWGKSLQALATGGVIQGPGSGTSDSILGLVNGMPSVRVSNGEGIVPADVMATPLGRELFSALLNMAGGGNVPSAVPWGVDPHGGRNGSSAGPFRPWWDMDWVPPEHPERIGPGAGWWWEHGPTNVKGITGGPWAPPIGKHRLPLPGDFYPGMLPDEEIKQWGLPGFKIGGQVGQGNGQGLNPGAANLSEILKKYFPDIASIGGRRPEDGFGEHSSGNAIDIMVGNNKDLGDRIAGFLRTNKDALGLNGMIWQQRSYGYGGDWNTGKMMDPRGSPTANHMDHVHAILGSGRGAGAAAAGLPTGPIISPTGQSVTGASTDPGSISSSSGQTRQAPTEKQLREANDRIQDRENQLGVAQQRLDEFTNKKAAGEDVKQSTLDTATNQRDKFARELEEAKADLETLKQGKLVEGKDSKSGTKDKSDDWSSVGGMIFQGFLEEMGFDGSVFKNLFDTPNVKSAMAGLNWGLGMLFPGDQTGTDTGSGAPQDHLGGDAGGGLLGVGADMLAGAGEQAGINFPDQATAPPGAPGPGNGPTFDFRGAQIGPSIERFDDKIGEVTAASKRYPTMGPG